MKTHTTWIWAAVAVLVSACSDREDTPIGSDSDASSAGRATAPQGGAGERGTSGDPRGGEAGESSDGTAGTASMAGTTGTAGMAGTAGMPSTAGTAGTAGMAGTASMAGTAGSPSPSGADCEALVSDPSINWRDSALQTDQEIVECLATSLGRPVGYGEKARGGYDPGGASKLTVITKDAETSVEQQIADAIRSDEHNWIVFDKVDFATPHEIALYRLQCEDDSVQEALGVAGAESCVDYRAWCADNGISSDGCLETFFNDRLDDSDLPIRNLQIGSNTTIDGRHSRAHFLFNGFAIGSDSSGEPVETENSVILTDLRFQGAGHTEDHGLDPDMIRATGASHDIWIHHNTFDLTGDSAFDVKVGAYNVTLSFNLVKNVKRAALHGSSDSREINEQIATTLHHNAFITTDEFYDTFGNTGRRVPLIRRGKTHLFNNLFYNYRKDVLSVRVGARVAFEDNMFLSNPAVAGDDDIDYFVENLLDDFREGGLEVTGSYVWLSDASCNLDPSASGDLTASHGSTSDPVADYSQASQTAIEEHRIPAGQELADYVIATAGKQSARPFHSPYSVGRAAILDRTRDSCQQ